MSCKLVRRHLGALVDQELDPATQVEFERHLETCVGCQEHLAFEASFRQQTREALGDMKAPEHLWERTLNRLNEIDEAREDRTTLARARPMPWRQVWPIAAAAAALLILGAVVGLPIPIIGSAVGALIGGALGAAAGAALGEDWSGRDLDASVTVGVAAFWGRILGTAGKVCVGATMLVIATVDSLLL